MLRYELFILFLFFLFICTINTNSIRKIKILTWYCLAQKRAWRHLSTASSVRGPGKWMRSSKAVEVVGPVLAGVVAFGRHRCCPWLLLAFFTSAIILEIGGDRRQPRAVTQDTIPSSDTPLCRFVGSKSNHPPT